jgi:hypothetical protein
VVAGLRGAASQPHNRGSFFWGQPVPDPGFGFYWAATYFRLTAVTTIGLILGVIYFFAHGRQFISGAARRTRPLKTQSDRTAPVKETSTNRLLNLFLLLSFIVFYIVFLSFGSKKQDRYIVPILPMVSLVAAWGYVWLAGKLRPGYWQNAFLALMVSLQALITFTSAPYYLSHYNRLAGGSRNAPRMLLVGWGEGLDLAARYLNARPEAETVRVSSWYHSAFEPFFVGQAIETAGNEKISRSAKPALTADYVVLYINQVQRQMPTPGLIQYYQSFPPEHVVTIDGIEYAYIYPSPAMQHAFSGEVRLVGQAELLGYDLLDSGGHPVATLPADREATLRLYWEWQGKAPDEPIEVSLVDANGHIWGVGEHLASYSPISVDDWAEGAIVREEFELRAEPGTPPGPYFLKAWIDRPLTGERVGDFPLLLEDARITVTRPTAPLAAADLPLSVEVGQSAADDLKLVGLGRADHLAEPWQPDQRREMVLYWQAEQDIDEEHPITLALVDESGVTRATWTGQPTGGLFPTALWQAGDLVRDPWSLTLPTNVPPGSYRLAVQVGDSPPVEITTLTVESRPRLYEVPPLDLPTNVSFGEAITLLGLQAPSRSAATLQVVPGQPLTISLVWQALDLVDRDYTITVQLLDEQQQVLVQRDGIPGSGAAPTGSWAVGEVVVDEITLDIPAGADPGPSQLLVALYHLETGERLRLPNGLDHLTIPVVSSR